MSEEPTFRFTVPHLRLSADQSRFRRIPGLSQVSTEGCQVRMDCSGLPQEDEEAKVRMIALLLVSGRRL